MKTGRKDLAKTISSGSPKPSNQSPVTRGGIRFTKANAYLASFVVPRWIDSRTSLFFKSGLTRRLSLPLLIRVNSQVTGKVAKLHSKRASTIRWNFVLARTRLAFLDQSAAPRERSLPLTCHAIRARKALGCIVLRDLAESIRRSFPEISDYFESKVQRIGCGNYFPSMTGRPAGSTTPAIGWRRSGTLM